MKIPFELVLSFAAGLALMAFLGYLLLVPRRFLWRLAAGAVLGAIALGIINVFGSFTGFTAAVNPFTSLIVGFLGLPGVLLVMLLTQHFL